MISAVLRRHGSIPGKGTFGTLIVDNFSCRTLEREWKQNQANVSSIPLGHYEAALTDVSALQIGKRTGFDKLYLLSGTDPRTGIYLHPANYQDQIEGCIALGDDFGIVNDRWAILNSRTTVQRFMDLMQGEELLLIIERDI